jgi:hypothetical protein
MTDIKKTKKIKVTRTIFEHFHLSSIASNQLERAKAEDIGHKFRWIVPSMAFTVFKVEALCNIYGNQIFPHWQHFESTSFLGKIVMISEFLQIKVDFSAQPWQDINAMKNFRNILAHAKPKNVHRTTEIGLELPDKLAPLPEHKDSILSYSSIENAERFEKAATELELMWIHATNKLGIQVDTVGRPKYEEVR